MSRFIAVAATVGVVALLGATYYATTQRGGDDPFSQCGASSVAGGAVGGPFTLVNGQGVTVTDAEVITEPTLVYFGYTFCPDVCPLDAARNAEAVDLMAAEGVSATPVFITVDPDRDNVEVVRDFALNFSDKMIGLTGSAEQIAAVTRAYKMYFQKQEGDPEYYLVDHSTFTYLALPNFGVVDFFGRDDTSETVAERTTCFAKAAEAMN